MGFLTGRRISGSLATRGGSGTGTGGTSRSPTRASGNTAVAQAEAISDVGGLISLEFYSATNASGKQLVPGAAAAISITVPYRGSVVAISANASGADTGVYTVHVNGTATDVFTDLGSATANYSSILRGEVPFSAGSTVDVRATGVSGANPVKTIVYLAVDPSSIV